MVFIRSVSSITKAGIISLLLFLRFDEESHSTA